MTGSLYEQLGGRNLVVRVISAVSLLPVVLGAVWFGGVPYRIMLAVAGVAMLFEWLTMVGVKDAGRLLLLVMAAIIATGFVILARPDIVLDMVAGLAFLGVIIAIGRKIWPRPQFEWITQIWVGAGFVYVGIPILALYSLRVHPDGALWVLWTLFIVWAMDVGGYFAGKGFGGPKLAPRISPKKTWSGLIGGMVLALITGAVIAWFARLEPFLLLVLLAPALAALSQVGDIVESAIKRHFDVKDAGGLIPGHGGLLDRVDGLIFVAPVVALFLSRVSG